MSVVTDIPHPILDFLHIYNYLILSNFLFLYYFMSINVGKFPCNKRCEIEAKMVKNQLWVCNGLR